MRTLDFRRPVARDLNGDARSPSFFDSASCRWIAGAKAFKPAPSETVLPACKFQKLADGACAAPEKQHSAAQSSPPLKATPRYNNGLAEVLQTSVRIIYP